MTANELRAERKKLEAAILERINAFESATGFIVKGIRLESYDMRRVGDILNRPAVHNIECEISLG